MVTLKTVTSKTVTSSLTSKIRTLKEEDTLPVTLLGTWVGNFNFEERHIAGYNRMCVFLVRHITGY